MHVVQGYMNSIYCYIATNANAAMTQAAVADPVSHTGITASFADLTLISISFCVSGWREGFH